MHCRVMWAHSSKALPPSPAALWSTVLPRPPRPSLAQSMPSSDVIDKDKGHCITNALQEHALALHQISLPQGVFDTSDPMRIKPLTFPGEVSENHPLVSSQERAQDQLVCLPPLLLKI